MTKIRTTKSKQGKREARAIGSLRRTTWAEYFAYAATFRDDYPDDIEDSPPQEREDWTAGT